MPSVTIENPILNSPFGEPRRHFRFDEQGITNDIVDGRRVSSYFMPIARPRKKEHQLRFDTQWMQDRVQENKRVNRIRERVAQWRVGGHVGVTATTARPLEYWTDPERDKKLFVCQIEAVETAIYLLEVAKRYGDAWIENEPHEENQQYNRGLPRLALKMATGPGRRS
jgi:type III restriction enzyme